MEVVLLNVIPRPIQELYLNGRNSVVGNGVVLHADISGFTTIAESLVVHGKKGAEILSGILNRIFSKAVDVIYRNGGIIAEFEGDAIIAVFPPDRPEAAYHAATGLERYFEKKYLWKSDISQWSVSVRMSLSHGQIEWGIIGKDLLAYFIKGSALEAAAAQLSTTCKPGTIGIHPSYSNFVRKKCDRSPEMLTGITSIKERPLSIRIRKKVASKFVSDNILSSKLTGEFRSVIPVFINIKSCDNARFRECVSIVLSTASDYGGELNGLYCSNPEYSTALVLFGAPVSWENNTSRAFDFSLKLRNDLDNSIRVGISEGTVYAGITGNSRRCKYSVYGDTVNTAARLLSKAEFGEILVTEKAIQNRKQQYGFSDTEYWLPRGKTDDILIGRLSDLKNSGIRNAFQGKMLGRSSQMETLLRKIQTVEQGKFAGVAMVYGEAGMGKSRLLLEASQKFSTSCQTYILKSDDILRQSLNPFIYFLKDLFQQNETENRAYNRAIFVNRMKLLIEELQDTASSMDDEILLVEMERATSIIGSILGYYWEDSVYSKLAAESKFNNTALALRTLVKALSRIKPSIFIIEDLHWMDNDSKRVIKTLTRNVENYPFVILISSRYFDDGSKPPEPVDESTDTISLDLTAIDRKAARRVIVDRLGAEPGTKLANFILTSSSGNPFYIEQFCLYMMESGLLSDKSGRYRFSSGKYDIPSGIKSILVARMDRLPKDVREILQTASILGQEFNIDTLKLISESKNNQKLLDEGQRLRLWSRQSSSVFAFNHVLYRNTAYGMVLGKNLHRLHSKAAEVLIGINKNNPELAAGEIALHLKESLQLSRAIEWGWKALCYSMECYRNNDVLEWTDRLKDWMMSQSSPGIRNELLLDVLLKKDTVLHSLGSRREQRDNIELMASICKEEYWPHRTAEVIKARGTLALSTGDIDSAFKLFKKGLKISNDSSDTSMQGKLFGNIANLYSMQGKNIEAKEYYDKALEVHRMQGNQRQEGVTLGNLAILLRRNGNEDEARECYEKALALHRKTGNRIGEGRILCGLGHLEDEPEDALVYYREALKINREIGDRRNEAIILSNLGRIETMRDEFSKSAEYLDQALQIHRQIDNSDGEADTHCLFGEMFYFMRKWSEAREHFNTAIEISRKTGSTRQECIYQGLLGLTNFEDGSIEAAVDSYIKTYKLIMDFQFPSSIDDSLGILRDKLLSEGIIKTEIPFPDHW